MHTRLRPPGVFAKRLDHPRSAVMSSVMNSLMSSLTSSLMCTRAIPYNQRMYQSEVTQFLESLKRDRPHLENEQRRARAIWWDKLLDRDRLARQNESRLPQPSYVYQPSTKR